LSALDQKTDFDYEIVIGDDCSTDRTREVAQALYDKHPDKIRLIFREKNLGGRRNFLATYPTCSGDYIALLEGDDFWTSRYKLQKQVNMLDRNPDLVISFHNVVCFYEDGSKQPWIYCPQTQRSISTLEDLLVENFIPTCSVMFRNRLISEFPDWYLTTFMGDWPLYVLHAQHGNIGYFNEINAQRRIHSGGIWSSLSRIRQFEVDIQAYRQIDQHLEFKYSELIQSRIAIKQEKINELQGAASSLLIAANHLLRCGDIQAAVDLLIRSNTIQPSAEIAELISQLGGATIPPSRILSA